MHSDNISKTRKEKSGVHPNISPEQMCTGNISKSRKEKPRKGAWPRSRDPINFGVHPNVSPKRVELETLVHRCTVAISQKPAKKI